LVVTGVFEFADTYGFPLPDLLDRLKSTNSVPCWVSFVESSKKCGWKRRTVLSKVEEAVVDIYGSQFWNEMKPKLLIVLDNVFGKE